MDKTLWDYQDDFLRFFLRHFLLQTDQEFLLSSPTGSGKTLVTQAIVGTLLGIRHFSRCLIITPQIQIEAGFLPGESLSIQTFKGNLTLKDSEWEAKRNATFRVKTFLHAANPTTKALVTTHAGVVRWNQENDFLPASLAGILLVVDEAHRAGEHNFLGKDFLGAWKERGGAILYLTATPFRTDGATVIPDTVRRQVRTIAEHADGIHAPAKLQVRALPLSLIADNRTQYVGDELAAGSHSTSCDEILALLKADHWPKTVIIVPSKKSHSWAALLEQKIRLAGKRVHNAVGNAKPEEELVELLGRERERKDYRDSEIDVILACKRFDEGTDWPMCSHIYNIGVPGAFNLILQRWGRAMRCKRSIAHYPKKHVDVASITFLVPHLSDEVWEKFEAHHKDHVFLLGCFLQDMDTAQEYRACLRWRPEDIGRQRSGKSSPSDRDLLEDIQSEVAGLNGEQHSAFAIQTSVLIEMGLRDQGIVPTLQAALQYATDTLKLPADQVQQFKDFWGRKQLLTEAGQECMERLVQRLKRRTQQGASLPTDLIREELRVAFDEVIALHEDVVIEKAAAVTEYIGTLTGKTAQAIAEDLRERLGAPDFTLDEIKAAILKFVELNNPREST